MGKIKTALEIALERTQSIKSDKSTIEHFEAKQEGTRLANTFLENSEDNPKFLEDAVKKAPPDRKTGIKEGVFETLLARIALPVTKDDEKTLRTVGQGLRAVISNNAFHAVYKQLLDVLAHYLEESAQYDKALREQYEPRLRQKEAELEKRYGQRVRLDALQDPEFAVFYKQNMDALKENYQAAVDQVKIEAVETARE